MLSGDLLDCDFLHFGVFQVQYIHYFWKHYVERSRRNFYIFFIVFINWKENKEVGTICFEVRIPMKKPKIFLEFFYVSFQNKILYLDSTTLFWKKTRAIILENRLGPGLLCWGFQKVARSSSGNIFSHRNILQFLKVIMQY